MSFTRDERKALQAVIHMARRDGRITVERCRELEALVERETSENNAPHTAAEGA